MQEEIHEFERLEVYQLVPRPDKAMIINLKWIFKVKLDEYGVVLKNKARLVTKDGYEDGISEWDFKGRGVRKSTRRVCQSRSSESCIPVKESTYDLKQAPRAWYDLLSKFLLSYKFIKGVVDPTLFTRKEGNDLILRHLEMLKKYGFEKFDIVEIPMVGQSKLDEDPNGTLVDPTCYRGMVGSLMYLTASHPDLVFAVYMCARFYFNKIPLYFDSHSAIALSCNTMQHSKTKYIAVRYHFIKEQVENELVELYFVKTGYQQADIFTKALARERFEFLIKCLGMQSITPKQLKRLAESNEK
ncbi:hypothetical protein Tco_1313319 [Tanacetum coccineum]